VVDFNGAFFTLSELGDPEHVVKRPCWALKVLSVPQKEIE
jgi:hypothetical protein